MTCNSSEKAEDILVSVVEFEFKKLEIGALLPIKCRLL